MKQSILIFGLLLGAMRIHAQVFSFTGINAAIPDGDPNGLVNVQTINGNPGLTIQDVNVSLTISGTGLGGFNGDLHVFLQHTAPGESSYATLLTRVGSRAGNLSGYSDSGLNVTFDDAALADVHNYRLTLSGDHNTPLAGSLTGPWQADGRVLSSGNLVSADRPAGLDAFNGMSMDGTWTLFVSDLSSGGTHRLESWGMQLTAIPEPATYAAITGIALVAFATARRLRQSASH